MREERGSREEDQLDKWYSPSGLHRCDPAAVCIILIAILLAYSTTPPFPQGGNGYRREIFVCVIESDQIHAKQLTWEILDPAV